MGKGIALTFDSLILTCYSQELASFLDQPDVITHVALVKPKVGLFVEDITSLLVICTPITVLLLGVALATTQGLDNRPRKEIRLYATDLSISTEVEMKSVIGTAEGRIFMCGSQDGHLYEFHYQEKESWFGKRVQLIDHSRGAMQSILPRFVSAGSEGASHIGLYGQSNLSRTLERITSAVSDLKRSCFYTLTSDNSISIYTTNGEKAIQHVQTLSNLYKSVHEKVPGSPAVTQQKFTLVDIHAVDPSESRAGIQLVATTSSGLRLFFAPSLGYGYSYGSSSGANGVRPLQLIHVRLPPLNLIHPDEQAKLYRPPASTYGGPQMQQTPSRSYTVHDMDNSSYADGLTIIAQPGDVDGTDYILCMAPDLTRIGTLGQLNLPQPSQPAPYNSTYGQYNSNNSTNNRPPLTEYATLLAIPGRTWAMAAIVKKTAASPSGTPTPTPINELATQFGESTTHFMLLTNVGLTFLVKRRALDYLKAVLEELQSEGNVQPIIEFRDRCVSSLLGLIS